MIGKQELVQIIKRAKPFAHLSDERLNWIIEHLQEQHITAGTVIFNEGDSGDRCYLICSGKIEIFSNNENKTEHHFATLKKSAIFGEVALLTEAPRNASARAIEDCQLLVLHKNDFLELVKHEKTTTDAVMSMMLERARPLANEQVTVHHRLTKDGNTVITLKNPTDGSYYQLSAEGLFIWRQLNGKQTLRDITLAFYKKFSVRAPESIYELICDLVDNGFANNPTLSTKLSDTELSWTTRALLKIRNILEAQWALHNVDTRLTNAYQQWAHLFFTKSAIGLMSVVIIMGLVSFIFLTPHAAHGLHTTHHLAWILVGSFIIASFSVLLHELAHAFATKSYGRHVYRMGVGWYWVSPIAFTDTSDMWLSDRASRTVVNIAGIFIDAVIAALCSIAAHFIANADIQTLLWLIAFGQLFGILRNLNPLLEYDGYYTLMDLLDKPDLRESALGWLCNPQQWQAHIAETIYWLCCFSFLLITAVVAYLIQVFVISNVLPAQIFGVSVHHLRWVLPLLAVAISSLGIYAEIRRRKTLATR